MSGERLSDEELAAMRRAEPCWQWSAQISLALDEVKAGRELVTDLRALHVRANEMPDYCAACTRIYPCPTIRMIDEAGL